MFELSKCSIPGKRSKDKPKEIKESIEAKWKTSSLFQEGTKSLSSGLSNKGVESYLPKSADNTLPCLDEKTGKERGFVLADLKSELISLSYSNMDRVVNSLEVMGLKTLLADAPIARPYTVDSRGRATYLKAPAAVTTPKIQYTCSQLPIFYKPAVVPVNSLTDVLKGPGTSGITHRIKVFFCRYGLS